MSATAVQRDSTSSLAPEALARQVNGLLESHSIAVPDTVTAEAAASTLAGLEKAITRLQAVKLRVLAAAERAQVSAATAAPNTGTWLSTITRESGPEAASQVRLATTLDTELPRTGAALDIGAVSTEHARVIAHTMSHLPDALDQSQRNRIEQHLLTTARRATPTRLRQVARRALRAAERDVLAQQRLQGKVAVSEEEAAWAKSALTIRDNLDGTMTGHFTVPTLAGQILRKAIQQLASPRRKGPDGRLPTDCDAAHADARVPAAEQGTPGSREGAEAGKVAWADVDWRQRYGQAFVELLEHLPADRLGGKVAATIVVTIDEQQLRDQIGSAHLDTGESLSAGQVRRLACNAGILPAVLGGEPVPVDLGTATRYFSEAQRVALATTYTRCAASGCDRPYAWAELHHVRPFGRAGPTDLDNAVPLCGFHHRRCHDPRYQHWIRQRSDGRREASFRLRTQAV